MSCSTPLLFTATPIRGASDRAFITRETRSVMKDPRAVGAVRMRQDSHALACFEALHPCQHEGDCASVVEANHHAVPQLRLYPELGRCLVSMDIAFNAHGGHTLDRSEHHALTVELAEIELLRRVGRCAGGKGRGEAQEGEEFFHVSLLARNALDTVAVSGICLYSLDATRWLTVSPSGFALARFAAADLNRKITVLDRESSGACAVS